MQAECNNCLRRVSIDFIVMMDYCPGCGESPFIELKADRETFMVSGNDPLSKTRWLHRTFDPTDQERIIE